MPSEDQPQLAWEAGKDFTFKFDITGLEGQNVVMQDIFTFRQSGVDEHGRVQGVFRPTGAVPTFFEHLKSHGLRLDPAMFDPSLDREVRLEIAGEDT